MARIQEHGHGPVSFAQTEKIEMLSDHFEKLGGSTLDKKRCSRSGVWPILGGVAWQGCGQAGGGARL